jgi:hypothetical protein
MASSWVDWMDLLSAVTWGESMARKTVELMAESMVIQTPVMTDDSTVALLVTHWLRSMMRVVLSVAQLVARTAVPLVGSSVGVKVVSKVGERAATKAAKKVEMLVAPMAPLAPMMAGLNQCGWPAGIMS